MEGWIWVVRGGVGAITAMTFLKFVADELEAVAESLRALTIMERKQREALLRQQSEVIVAEKVS